MKFSKDFKKIKGDASFREFYRNKKKNSILVYANKEKNTNLLIYDAVNKILIKNKVIAPSLIYQNYQKNYIEIKDLGNKTIYQIFIANNKNLYPIFKKIIKVLNKIQLINKENSIKTIDLIFNYENELNNRSIKIDGLN